MTSKIKQDSQRELTTNKIISCINQIKPNTKSFSQTILQQKLKELNCPYWHRAGGFLNKLGIIQQIDYATYVFTDKEIIKSELYEILKLYRKKHNQQCESFRNKKLTLKEKANLDPMDFDKACKIVRSFGYKIFKEI